jgi:MoxR-like ATPase
VTDILGAAIPDVPSLRARLERSDYLADEGLATALFCAVRLGQPVLLEGEAGVGKTSAATALGAALATVVIRLQCYEGIDLAEAVYEWNYPRQLLAIRLAESSGAALGAHELFGRPYLVDRPLLRAVEHPGPLPAVLLIDEIDRADEHFEAFLLELLADGAITIPELGTIKAVLPPIAVLTSNRTRDLHDALKRRCLYHWIDHPGPAQVVQIVRRRVPAASEPLIVQVAEATERLRTLDLQKSPGTAEIIDWVEAAHLLSVSRLDAQAVERTLGAVVKYREDADAVAAAGFAWVAGG